MQEIASCGEVSRRVQSVLLLTDGNANKGIRKADDILSEMKKTVPKFAGNCRHVHTFGVGHVHDSTLLDEISTAGNGHYYYIDSGEKIVDAFAKCVGGLLSVIGENLTLEMQTVNGTTISEVHSVHGNADEQKDADSCVLKMGDIQLHEQATVLMKLCLPETRENQDNVLNVHLNYFDMKQISEKNIPAHLTVRRSNSNKGIPKQFVKEQRDRAKIVEAFKCAYAHASTGKMVEAKTVLKDAMEKTILKDAMATPQSKMQTLHEDMMKGLRALDSDDERHAQHYMLSKMHSGCPIS
jgi:hypothetical protein